MRIRRQFVVLLAAMACVCQWPLGAMAQNLPAQGEAPLARVNPALAQDALQLHPVPGFGNAQGWLATDFDQRRPTLHTLYLEPIEVQAAADSSYRDLAPDELAALDRQFHAALVAQVPPGLTLVAAPQPDSIRVRVTLQQSEMKKDGFHLLNLTPIGFLVSHAKTAVGVSKVSFVRMVVGVRAYDSHGNALLALEMKPQGIPADPGSALDPAAADPDRVPMSPVRLDQLPTYLAAKTSRFRQALHALES